MQIVVTHSVENIRPKSLTHTHSTAKTIDNLKGTFLEKILAVGTIFSMNDETKKKIYIVGSHYVGCGQRGFGH